MKRIATLAVLAISIFGALYSQVELTQTRHYQWPVNNPATYDSVLSGLEGIRCVAVGDLNNDGKPEFVVTNYKDRGHVHVFTMAGQDSFELVWSSPRVDTAGGTSSPRNVIIADLDGDGKKEIVYESAGNGIMIFEWDGNPGYNFGTKPSQIISSLNCVGFPSNLLGSSYTEKMSAVDLGIDNSGQQELVMSYRSSSSAEQKYMIIRASGDWSTDDPGFSGFDMLYVGARPNLGTWGLSGGSAFSMNAANLDGQGAKEVVLQAYSNNDITILRYSNGQWVLADTTNNLQNLYMTPNDGVSYFGALVTDIDKDGRDEVYFPTNVYTDPDPPGIVRVIYYNSPSKPTEIDSNINMFSLDFHAATGASSLWGYGYGDIDGNGKPNIYFSTSTLGAAIVTAEFEGGNKTDPNNWKISTIWKGDSTDHSLLIKDSLGTIDTTHTIEFLFPSKIFAQNTDIDNNGREDIVMGFQPWYYGAPGSDSVSVTKLTWNSGTSQFDTTYYRYQNPKRMGFAVIEKSSSTGVQVRNLTFITPDDYKLNQNYPNPFNPTTNISFVLPLNKNVTVKIYDMVGKEVATLLNNEPLAKGTHNLTWNGHDNAGKQVASGAYIFRMNAGDVEKSIKMMLVK